MNKESVEYWLKQKKRLFHSGVRESEIPDLWKAMTNEGVSIQLTTGGYQLYVGRFAVTNKSVADAFTISTSAMKRVIDWAIWTVS
tara:strand:+ start:310 stop:564 length:255 start_codon:yes stop_codon:yes gene_type:complete